MSALRPGGMIPLRISDRGLRSSDSGVEERASGLQEMICSPQSAIRDVERGESDMIRSITKQKSPEQILALLEWCGAGLHRGVRKPA